MSSAQAPLAGKVALVAGATRGAGRGIAVELGAAGATVYCTGRSSRAAKARTPSGDPFDLASRPETIEDTAELVTAAGGRGVGAVVDHLDSTAVTALLARIRAEHGRLDLLVNDIWGGDALVEWGKPFWELDGDRGDTLLARAVKTHIVTSRAAVPLMLETRARGSTTPLVVEITDGDAFYYRSNLYYDLAKLSVIRLAFAMSEELRPHGIAALAVTPGFLRSEAMLEHFGVSAETWREGAARDPHFLFSESPRYVGRGIAALAADADVMTKSGTLTSSWELAATYGFDDIDGTRPDWGAHAQGEDFGAEQRASHERFIAPSRRASESR
jgi:NAD(P)-dependent dehydrogenase (short-subunit alcohol dehydrogenase family)